MTWVAALHIYSAYEVERHTHGDTDRWSLKLAVVSLVIVAALNLFCQLPGSISFLLIPLAVLGYVIAAFVISGIVVYCVIKKRPRRGASVLLALILPVLLWHPMKWADNVVHLGLTVGLGAGQLSSSSKSNDNSFVAYDWSVGLAGANTFLIHDVTDEIVLPMPQHTLPPSSENGFGEECAGNVQRVIKHYYLCSF